MNAIRQLNAASAALGAPPEPTDLALACQGETVREGCNAAAATKPWNHGVHVNLLQLADSDYFRGSFGLSRLGGFVFGRIFPLLGVVVGVLRFSIGIAIHRFGIAIHYFAFGYGLVFGRHVLSIQKYFNCTSKYWILLTVCPAYAAHHSCVFIRNDTAAIRSGCKYA